MFEKIEWYGKPLAYLIRAEHKTEATTFITPAEFTQQVGYVVYPKGGEIPRHVHRDITRTITGTSEFLIVQSGHCEIDIYNEDRELVATRELSAGDMILILGGGHGFRMKEDTVFLEIKQGPYIGLDEKERF